ncbi:MAG: hypothetical protein FWH29_02880 [Methanobrevibacter sp.]|nr:hypothetical protein [Methanobrevibacter sp.]
MTNTIKILVSKIILKQIERKIIKVTGITNNGEIELEVEDCDFWDRMEKRDKIIDEGKGIKLDVDELEESYLL